MIWCAVDRDKDDWISVFDRCLRPWEKHGMIVVELVGGSVVWWRSDTEIY